MVILIQGKEIMQLDNAMLQAYQKRWRSVAEVEAREQQNTSSTQRWQRLNSLLRMAAGLGLLQPDSDKQAEFVRNRWNRLRNLYLLSQAEQQL